MGSAYVLSLYDILSNIKVYTGYTTYSPLNKPIHFNTGLKKTEKAVLVAVAVDQENPSPCNTYILPIIYRSENEDEIEPFRLPLNDFYPIPDGILINETNTNTDSVNFFTTPGGIATIVCSCLIFVLITYYLLPV